MNTSGDIVMLANGHSPFDTRIFVKEARSLVSAGFRVSIIVPATKDEERDGVKILAVPQTKKGWQKLITNPWNILRKSLRQSKQAIYIIHDSDTLVAGIFLKITGRKVIYDAHEDTPLQISYQHWIPRVARKPYALFYLFIEKLCGKIFDGVVVAEPVIAKYFPPHKTVLVRNFAIAETFRSHSSKPYSERKKRLVYLGTLSAVRGLFSMVDAATLAFKNGVSFELTLGGKFAPLNLEQQIKSVPPVNFLGWMTYPQMVEMLFDSRAGIIVSERNPRYTTNYPVKLFEYMASGLPVIVSKYGEVAAFVTEARCGILVEPADINEIADAIAWIFNHPEEAEAMGRRGQELIFNKYNWENEKDVLIALLNSVNGKR